MLLLGVANVAAGWRFYVARGLAVTTSSGLKYVESPLVEPVTLALYVRQC